MASSPAIAAKRPRAIETASSRNSTPAASAKAAGPELPPRPDFSSEEQQSAQIPGFPGVRFWASSEEDYARAVPPQPGPWLVLSTGAEDGAYGAGFLNGWSASGERPDFSVVTGVSSGAIIAVYAFAGPKYDALLRQAYTTVSAVDIFELRVMPESFADSWPLAQMIERHVTGELISDIAAEHRRGRRLFVLTTNLDAGRAVAWDMGAIAATGGDAALALFRKIVLASSSVPGALPPVLIEAESNGRRFQEMHVDGGVNGPMYIAPESILLSTNGRRLPASELYVIVNGKLTSEFARTEQRLTHILGRSFSLALKLGARAELFLVAQAARRDGIAMKVAMVDQAFDRQERGLFDPEYMKALFDLGVEHGKRGEFRL
ncbi:MAG: patatin-like phospholipase family protein [Bradyrhizobium sp.]|uniref:patatin-like phospholipase family protein n=1 Tax=Bradyrhizobium sp. TaxID=376 RepID=UPI0025C0063B|nr:patatin-like phospholipase family protein [Bradyrhizobium sp.]MBI5264036.1 patatin-like phospholipase family protein [Bradyrhizobium sp.]